MTLLEEDKQEQASSMKAIKEYTDLVSENVSELGFLCRWLILVFFLSRSNCLCCRRTWSYNWINWRKTNELETPIFLPWLHIMHPVMYQPFVDLWKINFILVKYNASPFFTMQKTCPLSKYFGLCMYLGSLFLAMSCYCLILETIEWYVSRTVQKYSSSSFLPSDYFYAANFFKALPRFSILCLYSAYACTSWANTPPSSHLVHGWKFGSLLCQCTVHFVIHCIEYICNDFCLNAIIYNDVHLYSCWQWILLTPIWDCVQIFWDFGMNELFLSTTLRCWHNLCLWSIILFLLISLLFFLFFNWLLMAKLNFKSRWCEKLVVHRESFVCLFEGLWHFAIYSSIKSLEEMSPCLE
jgi:hypothetical protein